MSQRKSSRAPAVHLRGLVKRYGDTTVLDNLDLDVRAGEVHGFLGPNGAGKSTTVRILMGEVRCDAGEVSVLGLDPWADAVALHRRTAYVPGDVELWPNLTGGEILDVLGRLHGGTDRARRDALVDRFSLDLTRKGRQYSKGNRQKVALVAAMSTDADLFLFDEPTSGLDPLMESEFQHCVHELTRRGATVLLSSHILAEVEALADRISVIRDGRIVETGTLEEMRHLSRTTVTVRAGEPVTDLADLPGVHDPEVLGEDACHVRFDADSADLAAVIRALGEHDVRSISAAPPSLEQLLLRHYGRADDGRADA